MLTVNELFSGIGSQRAALERLGIEHEVVGIAEIDKFAIKSYEAIWGETKNYGDISKVDKLDYADFWTYSFPCQDISVAGKQAGINENTRSGLLYEVERLLEVARQHNELPKYLMLENVKNLVGKKFKPQFEEWITRLDELGYNTYWQVLNAKNYGIPQNRERVFGVSIRKDVDTGYVFPEPFELKIRLKDVLEDEVDEKFYISQEKTEKLISQIKKNNPNAGYEQGEADGIYINQSLKFTRPPLKDLSRTLKAANNDSGVCVPCITPDRVDKRQNGRRFKEDGDPMFTLTGQDRHGILQIGELDIKGNEQIRRVYSDEGVSPTLSTMQGGNRQPKILQVGNVNPSGKGMNGNVFNQDGLSPTITTNKGEGLKILEPTGIDKSVNNPRVIESANCITSREDRGISNRKSEGTAVIEPIIAASRGRNPNNPSDRTPGSPTEQRLEVNQKGTSNTITTVQKDNYVLEPNDIIKEFDIPKEILNDNERQRRVYNTRGISPTVLARTDSNKIITNYRIRKLTPKECWRLMGFTDEQFYRAAYGHDIPVEYVEKLHNRTLTKKEYRAYHRLTRKQEVSNSQLYKQAGNSIVVDVLYYLFKNLFIDKPKYKIQISNEEQLLGQMSIADYIQEVQGEQKN